MRAPRNTVGMQQLMPGVYFDGTLVHIFPAILCERAGIPEIPESMELVAAAVTKRLVEVFGEGARELDIVSERQPECGIN